MRKLIWHTERRKVKDLIPYGKNPRTINDKQEDGMDQSFTEYDYVELIAINLDGTIIAGHRRREALMRAGRGDEEIEVRVPNRQLTKEEFEKYLLISNRSGGTWDWDILAEHFDISTLLETGFDTTDLSMIFDENLSVEDDDFNEAKELEKAKSTKIKNGDVFQLGPHRLICGDSTISDTVKKLVGKEKIDLINIDFPYNIGVDYSKGLGGKQQYGGTINDKKSNAEYQQFLTSIIQNALAVSNTDCHVFSWLDEKYIGMLQELYKDSGINFKRLCMWVKGSHNPTPQIAFNRMVELCMYGTKGKPYLSDKVKNLNEVLNKDIGSGNRVIDDIMDLFQIWLVKRLPGNEYEHPTTKPPSLYEKSLRRCSKPGDSVLDLTAGSGSLLIAAEALKRRAFLAEVEPIFCQVIVNRYEKATGIKAKKLN